MILCRNGHENPVGATYCSTCFVLIDATAAPEPEPTPEPVPEPEPTPEPEPEPTPEPEPEPEEPPTWPGVAVGLKVELEPQTSAGRTTGEHVLTVHNLGSSHLAGQPVVTSVDDALGFELEPGTLSVAPGATVSSRLRAIPRRQIWIGRARTHAFRVAASADAAVDGAMVQNARIPLWLPVLVVVLVLLGGWAGAKLLDDDEPRVDRTIAGFVATQERNLNVRRTPNGERIGSLARGRRVRIVCETTDEWFRITSPLEGYVFARFVRAERAPPPCV